MYTDEQERNQMAIDYLPLIKKISHQMLKKCSLDYDEIESFAREGFVIAMNTYDPNRSSMTFTQFAAYGIRNAIFNGISDYSTLIHVPYYMKKKMKERGEEIPSSVSLNKNFDNEDHLSSLGFEDNVMYDNPWEVLIRKLKANFTKEYVDMFCSLYGLDGHEVEKGKDIANRLGISGCLVTKRTKKILEFIKEDPELSELLRELL